ncbi:hypothetical protein [Chryseobacterium pennipullorum]|uniref:Glycosyltransferase family 1 protein n=1 Tax=Chryseobacterium pennipullorum TaxID=2258963 RepID=A0A3D9B190_9FLAO|nr:hypothetical protein [Chryseobacterium pennipullorum]REC47299.1 hypothetical protein DRF67_11825 [Chryseobacterium pennipullorum]
MKKIAYIEIDTHVEIAQAFMNIMEGSQHFAVDYYFSKKIKDQVIINDQTVYLSDSSMISEQLKAKEYDLVLIGTVHRFFNTFLAITEKCRTAVISHNLNFTKASKWDLMKSVFKEDLIYRLKLWWKEGLFYAPEVYRKSGSLLVLDQGMSSERHLFLPLFFTQNFEKAENKSLTIVIPGGVSQKRRDYVHIVKTIGNMRDAGHYTFVFLGKAKDHELKHLKHLSAQLPRNIQIIYFSERVPAKDFESWMQKADVLWCPIQQETEFFSMKEVYGITKMTGNLGDAIAYGKLAIFPPSYPSELAWIVPEKNIPHQFREISELQVDFHTTYCKEEVQKRAEAVLSHLSGIENPG